MPDGQITTGPPTPPRSCTHDGRRHDGCLDNHCLHCGREGYWIAGRAAHELHPSGKLMLRPWAVRGMERTI